MSRFQDIDFVLAKMLLDRVQARKGIFTYGECADQLTAILGKKVDKHYGLRIPLEHVCDMCVLSDAPFLSTLVVYKNDLQHSKTGDGFYKIACKYRNEYASMNPAEVWEAEYYRVRKCTDWSSLSDFLARHST